MPAIPIHSHVTFLLTGLTATKHVDGDLLPPIALSTLPSDRPHPAGQDR
jgi:hypothetical protein